MDEEQTKNTGEAEQTAAGDNIEVQETITNRAGKDADGGGEYKRLGFCSNQDVSAGGKGLRSPWRIIQCLTPDYTDYLRIVAKAARIAGS